MQNNQSVIKRIKSLFVRQEKTTLENFIDGVIDGVLLTERGKRND